MSNKRKREVTDLDELKDVMLKLHQIIADENDNKRQKQREDEEKEMAKEMRENRTSSINVEAGIKNILKEIMHPVIEKKKESSETLGGDPTYYYTIDIPYPNCLSYNQMTALQALQHVISVECIESKKIGYFAVMCTVSKNASLKMAYGQKDLMASKALANENIKEKNDVDEEQDSLARVVYEILLSNLSLDRKDPGIVSRKSKPNGMEIAILTQSIIPPVSIAQIRRVKTHNDTVIANCFFRAQSMKSNTLVLVLEMCDYK